MEVSGGLILLMFLRRKSPLTNAFLDAILVQSAWKRVEIVDSMDNPELIPLREKTENAPINAV